MSLALWGHFLIDSNDLYYKIRGNIRKHDQGVMMNSSFTFNYLHKHSAGFCWFFLPNMSYVLKTSISFIFTFITHARSFQLPQHTEFFSPSSLWVHFPCAQNTLPQLSAWLLLHPSGSSLKSMFSESSSRPILSQESFPFLHAFPIFQSTYHHL